MRMADAPAQQESQSLNGQIAAPNGVRTVLDRASWNGKLTGRRTNNADFDLISPLRQSSAGGSGAFLALANDGRRYWVKPPNSWLTDWCSDV